MEGKLILALFTRFHKITEIRETLDEEAGLWPRVGCLDPTPNTEVQGLAELEIELLVPREAR